jgi:hypothetical protein
VNHAEQTKPCKNGDLACGQGHWYCGRCKDESRRAAYKRLTPAQKAYDNYVDPLGAYHTDYDREPQGCSCHISPPCSYCVNHSDDEDEVAQDEQRTKP